MVNKLMTGTDAPWHVSTLITDYLTTRKRWVIKVTPP